MIDAYEIGVELAMQEGVSAGLEVIAEALAALDVAVEATGLGRAEPGRGDVADVVPPLPVARSGSSEVASGVGGETAVARGEPAGSAPVAPVTGRERDAVVALVPAGMEQGYAAATVPTETETVPVGPAAVPESADVTVKTLPTSSAPIVVAPVYRAGAAEERLPETPAVMPAGEAVAPLVAGAPVGGSVSGVVVQTGPPRMVASIAAAPRMPPAQAQADQAGLGGGLPPFKGQVETRAWQIWPTLPDGSSAPLEREAAAVAPDDGRSAGPFRQPDGRAEAVRPERAGLLSERATAPAGDGGGRGEERGGVVMLDGRLVGQWLGDRMAREAGRPSAGMTSFDPRQAPAWTASGVL